MEDPLRDAHINSVSLCERRLSDGNCEMNLVNIIGRADDFDRVCAKYLLDCDMHIENAVEA